MHQDHADNRLFMAGGVNDAALPRLQAGLEPVHAALALSPIQARVVQPGGLDATLNRGTVALGSVLGTNHVGIYQNVNVTGANAEGEVLRLSEHGSVRMGLDCSAAPSLAAAGGSARWVLSATQAIAAGGGAFLHAGSQLRVLAGAQAQQTDGEVNFHVRMHCACGLGVDPSLLLTALLGLGAKLTGARSSSVDYYGRQSQAEMGHRLRAQGQGPWAGVSAYLVGLGLLPPPLPLPLREDPLARQSGSVPLRAPAALVYSDGIAGSRGLALALGPIRGTGLRTDATGNELTVQSTGPTTLLVSLQRQTARGHSLGADMPLLAEVHRSASQVFVRRETYALDLNEPAAQAAYARLADPAASLPVGLSDDLDDPGAIAGAWRASQRSAPAGVTPLSFEQICRPALQRGAGAMRLPALPQARGRGIAKQYTQLTEHMLTGNAEGASLQVRQGVEWVHVSPLRGVRRDLLTCTQIQPVDADAAGAVRPARHLLNASLALERPRRGARNRLLGDLETLYGGKLGFFQRRDAGATYAVDVQLALDPELFAKLQHHQLDVASLPQPLRALARARDDRARQRLLGALQRRDGLASLGRLADDLAQTLGVDAPRLAYRLTSDLYDAPLAATQTLLTRQAGTQASAKVQRRQGQSLAQTLWRSMHELQADPIATALVPGWRTARLSALKAAAQNVHTAFKQRYEP